MVEAGPILAAALLEADLVDEAALLRSVKVIGPDGIAALEGLPLTALAGSSRLQNGQVLIPAALRFRIHRGGASRSRIRCAQRRAVEPLVDAPQAVQPARIGQ